MPQDSSSPVELIHYITLLKSVSLARAIFIIYNNVPTPKVFFVTDFMRSRGADADPNVTIPTFAIARKPLVSTDCTPCPVTTLFVGLADFYVAIGTMLSQTFF
jgi:hypothetical protein